MASCVRHPSPITVSREPDFVLTAGAFETPAPLGAALLSLDPGKRQRIVRGLPGYRETRVILEWPDMGLPVLTADDWLWLAPRLRKLGRLHVHCRAGHGRTGTTLAILASLWDLAPRDADPVAWVRERYCPNAVETAAQCAYVARMTGRAVTAPGSLGAPARPAPLADDWSPRGGWAPAK